MILRSKSTESERANRRAQVLIEFALAAAGLIAIAFVSARVGIWLNDSLVQRNASFQNSRVSAGQSQTLETFDAPGQIRLIGGAPLSAGGLGNQPPETSDTSCSADAQALFAKAQEKRMELLGKLFVDVPDAQEKIQEKHEEAEEIVIEVNEIAWDALTIAIWLRDILDPIDAWLNGIDQLIDAVVNVPAIGGINMIDERIEELIGEIEAKQFLLNHPGNPNDLYDQIAAMQEACEGGSVVEGPVQPITSCFGPGHPLGIDINVNEGITPILAYKSGTIINAVCDQDLAVIGYGNYIDILHEDGTMTRYSHLDSCTETSGLVSGGQEIGIGGDTGNSTGPHLHFELHDVDGTRIDPLGGESCTQWPAAGFTTSEILGSGGVGICDPDQLDVSNPTSLVAQAMQLGLEIGELETEKGAYEDLLRAVEQLRADKAHWLGKIDDIVDKWNGLYFSEFGEDLSPIGSLEDWYLDVIADLDDQYGSHEPGMTPQINNILNRLGELIKRRLDLADSVQDELCIYTSCSPYQVPNDTYDPGKYGEANNLAKVLREHANAIQELLREIQSLEQVARTLCGWGSDEN